MKRPEQNKAGLLIGILLLGAFVVRLPFYQMRPGFDFVFRCVAIVVFVLFIYYQVNKWVGLFLLLALFSHSIPMFYISGFRAINTPQSYSALNSVLVGCAFFAGLVMLRPNMGIVLDFVCIIAALNCLWLLILYFGGDPYRLLGAASNAQTNSGFLSNPNESGALMALTMPAFFRKGRFGYLAVSIVGIILSKSAGGFVAALLAILAYLCAVNLVKVPVLTFLALIAVLYVWLVDLPGLERLYPWKRSLEICFRNNPVLGCGLGNWKLIYPPMITAGTFESGWIRLHSSFIQGYVEMGVGFIVFLGGMAISTLGRIRPVVRSVALPLAGVAAVIGTASVNSMFRMNKLNAMLAVTWLAILEIELRGIHAKT